MAKRIKTTKSKNSESYCIIDDFTDSQTKKRSTFVVESLGSLNSLKQKYNVDTRDEVLDIIRSYLNVLRDKDKFESELIPIHLSPSKLIPLNEERLYNVGYLYPRNILSSLKFKDICHGHEKIPSHHI